jgi:16S rRNA (cytosine967-C5)-methyltransferase
VTASRAKRPARTEPADRSPRAVALAVLDRIERGGAYANLVLGAELDRVSLETRDRAFVTELVYGVTRMRRACDWLVDRFALREIDVPTRTLLRLGAYQLAYLDTPPHAAVDTTVSLAPRRTRGFVNAVLRRVAATGSAASQDWPDDATRLSYPDWIVERLTRDLGATDALDALAAMNQAAHDVVRPDGYHQDLASQWVGASVAAQPGERVLDLCAGPGGKATALAAGGATVIAADAREGRARLVVANAAMVGSPDLHVVAGDGRRPPFVESSFDRVLVDAPCSGLGSLRRRPDARWRADLGSVTRLAALQHELVLAASSLLRPGGQLTFSVCTMTEAETSAIDEWMATTRPALVVDDVGPPPGDGWAPRGRGWLLLPQTSGTDGMYLLATRRDGPR